MVQYVTRRQWGKRYSRELEELYNEPNVVNVIKSSRLKWAGHVVQMDDNKLPKKILWTDPGSKRGSGQPKSRWLWGGGVWCVCVCVCVDADARKLDCRNWLAAGHHRKCWQNFLEEAKGDPEL